MGIFATRKIKPTYMKKTRILLLLLLLTSVWCQATVKDEPAEVDPEVFTLLNLDYPGLGQVKANYQKGDLQAAAKSLLDYYRGRTGIVNPDINLNHINVSARERKWADEALEHTFYVHDGYQPSFNYGKDINWQYWPVKDNELRWQLHRHKWFTPMGKVYRQTGDERYAKEWAFEYIDWMRKNPLVEINSKKYELLDPADADSVRENVRFAWRPLETSHRLQDQISQFTLFLPSPHFTPAFLTQFLCNYYRHANHIMHNYSAAGNHLLFESQRMFFAGTFFPEFKDAKAWQQSGISILNREIAKQVYPDGGQFELDPHYHLACINIFCRALEIANANHNEEVIPQSYKDIVEKMIVFYFNICFPDYTNPCFSDAKQGDPKQEISNYKKWSKIFPANEAIRYFATKGREGRRPDYLSKGFLTSGFFTFRNGWGTDATVMVVKAGPKGEWHCQPDNGTFDLWFNGRNLFPDTGSYIYAGEGEVQKMRNWFRQTRVHNTLTLDGRNLETTQSRTLLWKTDADTQVLVTENPSYKNLTHRRTVFFTEGRFVIVDEASGPATGKVNLHYLLTDGKVAADAKKGTINTRYDGQSNVFISCIGSRKPELRQEEGWYSLAYRQKTARPAFSYDIDKTGPETVSYVTLIVPNKDGKPHSFKAKIEKSTAKSLLVAVNIDGKKQTLAWNL